MQCFKSVRLLKLAQIQLSADGKRKGLFTMKTTKRLAKIAYAVLAGMMVLATTSCGSIEDKYLKELDVRVSKLEKVMQTGDRASYDEADKAVKDFLDFNFEDGSKEAKIYGILYKGSKSERAHFESEEVQAKITALKECADMSKIDNYLKELDVRVSKLEEVVQTGDRTAYDEAEKAVNEMLYFELEKDSYDVSFKYGEKFKSEEVQSKITVIKERADKTGTSAPAQGKAEYELKLTKDEREYTLLNTRAQVAMWSFPQLCRDCQWLGLIQKLLKIQK